MRIKDARQTFLGIWIRNLIEKKPIQVFGDGKQRRDYNYVDDVVDALIIAATRNESAGKIYNLGAPRPISLQETAQIMCEGLKGATYELVPFPEERKAIDVGDFISDYSIFQSSFGWNPKVSFTDGIKTSFDYFRKEFQHYTWVFNSHTDSNFSTTSPKLKKIVE